MQEIIDKIDRRILYELDQNARISDTALAKLVLKSKESVRYRIAQLKAKGIIEGFSTWIDPTKLGYQSAKIYLTIANIPKRKKELFDYIKANKHLMWFGVAEGVWNVGLTYFIKSSQEFFKLKNDLFSKFSDIIIDSKTGTLVDVNVYSKTFLYKTEPSRMLIFDTIQQNTLDEIEKKALSELQKDGRISVVEIARKHNTTVDIVKNRIRRLEEKKIVAGYFAKINYEKLGCEFYKTFLYISNLSPYDERRLIQFTLQHPNIIHVVRQISPWDIELEILCESFSKYNEIINEITKEFSTIIRKVETAIMSEDHIFPAKVIMF